MADLATAVDTDCGSYPDWEVVFDEPCDLQAFATVTAACIHEHIDNCRVCYSCAGDIQQLDNWICTHCADGPQPHECGLLIQIKWDSGEVVTMRTTP